jgi:hypothetical protein
LHLCQLVSLRLDRRKESDVMKDNGKQQGTRGGDFLLEQLGERWK